MKFTFAGSFAISVALTALLGCEQPEPSAPEVSTALLVPGDLQKQSIGITESSPPAVCVRMLTVLNDKLQLQGKKFRVAKMEYITAPGSGQYGSTVFAKNVGNKQLAFQFVGDLVLYPGFISYVVDETEGDANGGLTNADTEPAIDRAMGTWDNVMGSGLHVKKVSLPGQDLGVVQNLLGYGGCDFFVAEVTHAGWLPAAFFDAIDYPNGSATILGVTFTFMYVDDNDNPIDLNRDHKYDAAFREIYYNDAFKWTNQPVDYTSPLIDVETIALHEGGHGFSQDHFGTIFFDGKGTTDPSLRHLHFAPRAVMNAIYWDTQRSLLGTDVAGHLSIWASWPD